MGAPPNSQVAPLPSNLPFRLISKNIGVGAYASIRKAVPVNASKPIIAIKFINKDHAIKIGRLSPKQIALEINIHRTVCEGQGHENIIRFYNSGEDATWHWIAMELADGGDLFDKIEADVGVPEEVAHVYFKQLISAVSWCHAKGMAHRDIKPENMLLGENGDLKLADFGLAIMFKDVRNGITKQTATVCGSPPYIAAEIVEVGIINRKKRKLGQRGSEVKYDADKADLWSCAIVLFVLLVGNTPWDQPEASSSPEYSDYLKTNGRPNDELWDNVPHDALSLIRGILRVDPTERFTLHQIETHPWFTAPNRHMNAQTGRVSNGVELATTMLERMKIDMSQPTATFDRSKTITQATQSATAQSQPHFAATQPDAPAFDWETSLPSAAAATAFCSQPTTARDATSAQALADAAQHLLQADISLSQFAPGTQGLPLTLTQAARRFGDIAPSAGVNRFYCAVEVGSAVEAVKIALLGIGIMGVERGRGDEGHGVGRRCVLVKGKDGRGQGVVGNVLFDRLGGGGGVLGGFSEVRFVKEKGDPVEWRRLFKKVAVGCRDILVVPGQGGGAGF